MGEFSKAGAIYLSDGGIYFDYSSPVSVTPTIILKMRARGVARKKIGGRWLRFPNSKWMDAFFLYV